MTKEKTVIVTGGAGFIGSHLVDQLLNDQYKVIVIDNLSTGKREYLNIAHPNLSFVEADICDLSAVESCFINCDYVFHLATASVRESLINPTLVHDVNTTGTYNTLKLSAKYKVEKFLYCSSSEVNGTAKSIPMQEKYQYEPETIYGASKLTGEYYTDVFHKSGWLNCVIARPHNNYGPREHFEGINGEVIPRFILFAKNNQDLTVYGDGSQTRDFTYVKDTARILCSMMFDLHDSKCEIYNICTGKETSVVELASSILGLIHSSSKIIFQNERPQDVLRLCGDNTKLSNTNVDIPQINLEEGLRETIKWFNSLEVDLALLDKEQFWNDCVKEDFINDSPI